jgi:prolyl-tRNA editing enzyme YbaK/EbsC (Cys-tRNA(Pro) deacylase)
VKANASRQLDKLGVAYELQQLTGYIRGGVTALGFDRRLMYSIKFDEAGN